MYCLRFSLLTGYGRISNLYGIGNDDLFAIAGEEREEGMINRLENYTERAKRLSFIEYSTPETVFRVLKWYR